jgi:hypothetical protein
MLFESKWFGCVYVARVNGVLKQISCRSAASFAARPSPGTGMVLGWAKRGDGASSRIVLSRD